LQILHEFGWLIIVVTNQPDVSRGKAKINDIKTINKYLKNNFPILALYTCYHDKIDNCNCRKPATGFFLKAKKRYKIDLKKSFMIGDRWSDIEAGGKAGCRTIFIDYNYNEKKPNSFDYKVNSLYEATTKILKNN
jgi:D-glycero-D-manno-heptose 1,7-bisphosphate phosphatase